MRTATLGELISVAERDYRLWEPRTNASDEELATLNKTKTMVVALSNYFEGRLDDFCEARRIVE
jgi:hypothetical protein